MKLVRVLGDGPRGFDADIEPKSVSLVAVRPRSGVPQVLGTDRHIVGGAVELEDVRWDDATRTLSGTALGGPGMKWRLAVYVPGGYRFDADNSAAATNLSDMRFEAGVLSGAVSFAGSAATDSAAPVRWSLRFEKP